MTNRVLIAGEMARDHVLADRFVETGWQVHAAAREQNPGLVTAANMSSGEMHHIDGMNDIAGVLAVAEAVRPHMFITNSDDALAADMAGEMARRFPDMLVPCPDKEAARLEWDKLTLRELVAEIDAETGSAYNPFYHSAVNREEVQDAIADFKARNLEMAVKPRNLTGGKGVKVMGPHFESYEAGEDYALQVIRDPKQTGVLIEEKLSGLEFTLQVFTDGKTIIEPPATYDYPYRFDGDTGPGTGGMGSFTMADGRLPFVSDQTYREAIELTAKIIDKAKQRGLNFKGVFYGSFFVTADGLKITEVNARGGDPELVNILDLAADDVDVPHVYAEIATGDLRPRSMRYRDVASVFLYLVSPHYATATDKNVEFDLDPILINILGGRTRFSAARQIGSAKYRTRPGRAFGVFGVGPTPWEARRFIDGVLLNTYRGPLKSRRDVGSQQYINSLRLQTTE